MFIFKSFLIFLTMSSAVQAFWSSKDEQQKRAEVEIEVPGRTERGRMEVSHYETEDERNVMEKLRELSEDFMEKAREEWETMSEKAHDAGETLSDKAHRAGSAIADKAHNAKEKIKDKMYDAKESVKHTAQNVKNKACRTKESIKDFAKRKVADFKKLFASLKWKAKTKEGQAKADALIQKHLADLYEQLQKLDE